MPPTRSLIPESQTQRHLQVALCLALCLAGCGEESVRKPFEIPETPGSNDAVDQDRDGWHDDVERDFGANDAFPDEPCVSRALRSNLAPAAPALDFIFIVDNSGSMSEELPQVREDLQRGFLERLATTDVDHRVLLITRFGPQWCAQDEPGQCSEPPQTSTFVHMDRSVASTDSMDVFLQSADESDPHRHLPQGWRGWLRPESKKVFVEITDDDSSTDAATFDQRLREVAPSLFFDARGQRRYTWHSVTGIDYDNARGGLSSFRPVIQRACQTAYRSGVEHQRLSILTGGLRFSVCGRVEYSEIFSRVLDASTGDAVPCRFAMPRPPNYPQRLSSTSEVGLQLVDSATGTLTPLTRVRTQEQCGPDAYTTARESDDAVVELCPQLCASLRQTQGLVLRAGAACERTCADPTIGC